MANKIEDFGKKIGGAKKDIWKKRGLGTSDLMDMNEKELKKYITKNNVWPTPNYQELLNSGYSLRAVYFIKTIKDSLPTKPVITILDNTPEMINKKQEGYVEFVSDMKKATMNVRTDADVLNFYENHLSQYLIKGGRYVEVLDNAYDCISNKLLKASQVKRFSELDRDIKKKQFLYTDKDKIMSNFMIFKYDDSITFDKDYNNKTKMNIKYPGGTMFFYPKDEFADLSQWQEGKYFAIKGRDIYTINYDTKEELEKEILSKEEVTKEKAVSKSGRKTKYKLPQFEHLRYEGPDYRKGNDIEGKEYLDILGFRGGEFGNWVNERERQESLNYGFESLMALSDALNIEPESVSLNNNLSIAFGARGSGSAVAHYESAIEVINLTKMNGAGSLAHEWGHAMDDILNKNLNSSSIRNKTIKRLDEHEDLIEKIKYKYISKEESNENREELINKKEDRIKKYIKRLMPDKDLTDKQIENRDLLIKNVLNDREASLGNYVKLGSIYLTTQSIEELSAFKKNISNRKIPLEVCKEINYFMYSLNKDRELIDQRQKVKTDFYKDAINIDNLFQKENKGYWKSSDEMFARAFACYVKDKAEEKGIKCDYLTGHAECVSIPDNGKIIRGYPVGEERKEINKAFDNLIDKYKELGLLKEKTKEIEIEIAKDVKQISMFSLDNIVRDAKERSSNYKKETPSQTKDKER